MRTADGHTILQCLEGNSAAFGFLVDKYKESVYALAYSMLHNFHDAEDVAQEVFIKAYGKLHTLKQYDRFHAWLFAITSNLCKNRLRSKSRRPDHAFIEDQDPEMLESHSLNQYRDELLYRSIHEALESLPVTYCQVLTLHYLGGMKTREIAEFLGTTPDTIKHRIARARAQLKEKMVAMMGTAFEEQKLQAGFTFRIVEAVRHISISPMPRADSLPWGISLAAGIVIAVLSIGSNLNLTSFPIPHMNPENTSEAEVTEVGEIPVDMLRTSLIPASFGREGDSHNGGLRPPDLQNNILMAPRGEGGEFPEEPSARLGKGALGGVAYSPDGKILAAAGGLGIWLYDAKGLDEIALLRECPYFKIAFSPDGKTLAVSDREYDVQLWNVDEQTQIGTLTGHTSSIYSIMFSPDNKTLASGSYDKTIHLWDVQQKKRTATLRGHTEGVASIGFSPHGKTLASGGWDKTIRLWDIQRREQIGLLQGHTEATRSVVFSPDGKTLASGSSDKTIRLWNVQEQKEIGLLQGHTDAVSSIAFSPDGEMLASGGWDKTVRFWDMQEQKQIGMIEGFTDSSGSLAFSLDGKTLALVDGDAIHLCDVQEQKQIAAVEGFTNSSYSLAFSPDGKLLASKENWRGTRLWDVQEQKQIGSLAEGTSWAGASSVAFTPDGKIIGSIKQKEIDLFDAQSQEKLGTLEGHTDEVRSIAFTPDGKSLVSGGMDYTVRIWDVEKQKEVAVLGNGSHAHCIAISPDGETIAAAIGGEGLVRLWDFKTRQEMGILKHPQRAAITVSFSPDGKTLASGNAGGLIYLWDYQKNKLIGQLQGDIQLEQQVTWAYTYFSPDGKLLAAVHTEGFILIWDVQKQEQIFTIEGQHDGVSAVAFSPDGKLFASGGWEGTILLWELDLTVPGWSVEPTGKQPVKWGQLKRTELYQNYPNPFNPETWIPYQLSRPADVAIRIYDQSGQSVRILNLGYKEEGIYLAKSNAGYWDGRNDAGESIASGVYFYQIEAGEFRQSRKMTVIR